MAGELDSFDFDSLPQRPAGRSGRRVSPYELIAEHEHVLAARARLLEEAEADETRRMSDFWARDYTTEYPNQDIAIMGKQLGSRNLQSRPFADMQLLGEPWQRRGDTGTARAYLGTNTRQYCGILNFDLSHSMLGLFIDHGDKTTFFHLYPVPIAEEGDGHEFTDRFLSGLSLVMSLAVELDVEDTRDYRSFREMIHATCSVPGC